MAEAGGDGSVRIRHRPPEVSRVARIRRHRSSPAAGICRLSRLTAPEQETRCRETRPCSRAAAAAAPGGGEVLAGGAAGGGTRLLPGRSLGSDTGVGGKPVQLKLAHTNPDITGYQMIMDGLHTCGIC
ncbi:hypothetical protein ACQJBY_053860 [Aegilops geniculata]